MRVCHACVPALGHAKWTPQSSSRRNLRLIVINLGPPGAPKAAYTFEGDTNLIRAIGSSQIARFRSLSLFRSFASTRHAVPFCGHTCEATSNGYLGTVLGLHHDQTADPSHRGINAIHYVCRRCSYLCLCVSVCMCLKGHISGPKHPIAQSLLILGEPFQTSKSEHPFPNTRIRTRKLFARTSIQEVLAAAGKTKRAATSKRQRRSQRAGERVGRSRHPIAAPKKAQLDKTTKTAPASPKGLGSFRSQLEAPLMRRETVFDPQKEAKTHARIM